MSSCVIVPLATDDDTSTTTDAGKGLSSWAMGRMFRYGGEDVMNKVLTPMQRRAIVTRQLDEEIIKEGKGTECHEIARTMMKQRAKMDHIRKTR